MRTLLPAAAALALWTLSLPALGQGEPTSPDRVLARTLFEEARADMKAHDYAKACPKLAESQRLKPGIGTLYNLGDCYEGLGRLATAWTMFSDVAEAAQRAGQADRAAAAKQRAEAIVPRLPHLRVAAGIASDVKLTLDGVVFANGLVDTAVPIDPGDHELGAGAPGKTPWSTRFQVREGATVPITVPALEPIAPPPALPAVSSLPSPEPVPQPPTAPRPPSDAATSWHVPAAVAAAGLGVVGLGIGSGFGVKAIGDWSTAKPGCSGGVCSPEAFPYWQSAHTAGIVSTVTFVAGAALVATGAVVWFTRPRMSTAGVGVRADGVVVVGGLLP